MRQLFLALLLMFPLSVAACPAPPPPAAARTAIDPARPDQALLAEAVLSQVNLLRCLAGRGALAARPGLTAVAATHSAHMAQTQTLTHTSTVRGQSDLATRLAASGEQFSTGAENVGFVPACGRNYLELANAMVRLWNDSRLHRDNMLSGGFDRAGAGVAFAGGCTRAYLTLDLAG